MSLNPRLVDWAGRRVWVIGASSGIGRALAAALHARGAQVVVSARKLEALQEFAATHPGSQALPLDATDAAAMQQAALQLTARGALELVCYCAGHYAPMRATELSLDELLRHQRVNVTGALNMLVATVPALLAQGRGHLSLVASVAGLRGLPRGLAYGPTKAALINLAETLYLDLHDHGLGVSLITPGFVDTPLTAHNEFRMPGLMSPQAAAQAILDGWARGGFLIQFPRRFTWALWLMRLLPYRLYFAMVRRFTGL